MIGVIYLLLSLAAIMFWLFEPSGCFSGSCSGYAQLDYLLDRPWWLWGAVFYAMAGAICLPLPKNRVTGAILAAGALFHAGLIWYGYTVAGSMCPVCWKFVTMGALLAAFYWILSDRRPLWASYVSAGPARALAVIAVALLLINPQGQIQAGGQAAESPKAVPLKTAQTKRAPEVAEAAECFFPVSTPDGTQVCLDMRQRPALFFAVWCPHCPEALKEVTKLDPEKRPYIVVTYLRDGEAEKARDKLAENGLAGEAYYLAQSPPPEAQGVPTLAWWEDGGLKCVEGAEAIAEKLNVPGLLGSAEIPNPPDAGARNAELAASMINGTVVQPGEVFSFNRAVGPRTVSRGFVEGRSVVENVYGEIEVVPDVGGGVCRTSTALLLAVQDAGMEMVEHHSHSLPVSYAEPGKDAAVAWPYWDLEFRNTAAKPVKIVVVSEDGKLRIELWLQ
ncbi:MAG TPA: VanW family protein [Bacillota bacterium]|nr:VanW family protein [Bacillota bacterium]